MLPSNAIMRPDCDRHIFDRMDFRVFGAEGITRASAWQCIVEGCSRSYSRGHGYQNLGEHENGPELNYTACPKCKDASAYVSGQRGLNAPKLTCDACGGLILPD
jgi:hypothetical protein